MLESIGIIALVSVIGSGIGVATVNENELTQEEMMISEHDQIIDQEAALKNSTTKWYNNIE